jgi:transcriptional regulator with XRE-family HTH domain
MPEIGATLREARMRARIDISEIEAETKIRAKYLRALENEEWDLLPGPAYVRSFLRTYAEALDLDAKLLLEEYKLRHERPTDHDLMPIGAPRRAQRHRRQRPRRGVPRGAFLGAVVIALVAVLYLLGKYGGDGNNMDAGGPPRTQAPPSTTTTKRRSSSSASSGKSPSSKKKQAAAARVVRLQILPTGPGPVFVCLQAAGNRRPIPGVNLQPGGTQPVYRSSRFRLTLGNGNVALRINGKTRSVPQVGNGIGYDIRRGSVKRLSPQQRPTCVR